ncbi:hypothetical protein K402DRAFT_397955 [Aulographum hederae CBS 113979]|uniref:Uncharacterized protein n=1 Tax=Aulographum hederae CBS 113979 TaxID=1176131 RepID=A0A6G1GMA8_9PEZI|nr:hypothetical protein K402DRAFT_397955 [Aulographum hederae CBS 113979]
MAPQFSRLPQFPRFFELPSELRNAIYCLVLVDTHTGDIRHPWCSANLQERLAHSSGRISNDHACLLASRRLSREYAAMAFKQLQFLIYPGDKPCQLLSAWKLKTGFTENIHTCVVVLCGTGYEGPLTQSHYVLKSVRNFIAGLAGCRKLEVRFHTGMEIDINSTFVLGVCETAESLKHIEVINVTSSCLSPWRLRTNNAYGTTPSLLGSYKKDAGEWQMVKNEIKLDRAKAANYFLVHPNSQPN